MEGPVYFRVSELNSPCDLQWALGRALKVVYRPRLLFGTTVHGMLADYFRLRPYGIMLEQPELRDWWSYMLEVGKVTLEEYEEGLEIFARAAQVMARLIRTYHHRWSNWEVVAIEEQVAKRIHGPGGGWTHYVVTGTPDLCIRERDRLYIVEHKTRDTLLGEEIPERMLQIRIYRWLTGIPNYMLNRISSKLPTKPALVDKGTRLSRSKIVTDRQTYLDAIEEYGLNPADYTEQLAVLGDGDGIFWNLIEVVEPDIHNLELALYHHCRRRYRQLSGAEPILHSDGPWCNYCNYKDVCQLVCMGERASLYELARIRYEVVDADLLIRL